MIRLLHHSRKALSTAKKMASNWTGDSMSNIDGSELEGVSINSVATLIKVLLSYNTDSC